MSTARRGRVKGAGLELLKVSRGFSVALGSGRAGRRSRVVGIGIFVHWHRLRWADLLRRWLEEGLVSDSCGRELRDNVRRRSDFERGVMVRVGPSSRRQGRSLEGILLATASRGSALELRILLYLSAVIPFRTIEGLVSSGIRDLLFADGAVE